MVEAHQTYALVSVTSFGIQLNNLLVNWPGPVTRAYAKVCLEVINHFQENVSIFSSHVDVPNVIGDPQIFHGFSIVDRSRQLTKHVDLS